MRAYHAACGTNRSSSCEYNSQTLEDMPTEEVVEVSKESAYAHAESRQLTFSKKRLGVVSGIVTSPRDRTSNLASSRCSEAWTREALYRSAMVQSLGEKGRSENAIAGRCVFANSRGHRQNNAPGRPKRAGLSQGEPRSLERWRREQDSNSRYGRTEGLKEKLEHHNGFTRICEAEARVEDADRRFGDATPV
jgi:hypothetical protein